MPSKPALLLAALLIRLAQFMLHLMLHQMYFTLTSSSQPQVCENVAMVLTAYSTLLK